MILPPPPLEALPAGYRLVAGVSSSTIVPDLDFETYSAAGFVWVEDDQKWIGPPGAPKGQKGLNVVGLAVYAAHPSTEVLTLSYDLKDGRGRRRWRPGLPPPVDLFLHTRNGGLLEAWNVMFERRIWECVCVERMGWPSVYWRQWRCAMAKARAHALPPSLGKAGEVLALQVQKDADGAGLLKKFSWPRNPTKGDPRTRIVPEWRSPVELSEYVQHGVGFNFKETGPALVRKEASGRRKLLVQLTEDAEDSQRLLDYNETDIATEAEASSVVPDLSPDEFRFWQDDQAINHRGVAIDMESVENCVHIIEQATRRYGDELLSLTGCKPTEIKRLSDWLRGQGVFMDSLDEENVELALTWNLPPIARRALEIRAAVGSASVKKVFAMRNQAHRGRLHDLYTFHGARTGRPTGNGPQPTNLPKAGPNTYRCGYELVDGQEKLLPTGGCGRHHGAHTMWCHWCGKVTVRRPKTSREWSPEAAEDALEAIGHRSLEWLEVLFGDAMLTIAGVLRALFIAAPGHDLVSSDFTAIEGVVIACIAGEQWRIDAYAEGAPMYLVSAERMFGVTVAEMKAYAKANGHHHPLRQKGKNGELGLGFGGWINALRVLGMEGADDELKETILKWRGASPAIEWLWGGQTKGKADSILVNAGRLAYADQWDRTPYYFGLEGAAVQAVLMPGNVYPVLRLDGTETGVRYTCRNGVLYCRVPTGGLITYHAALLEKSDKDWRGLSLSFMGWNTNPKAGPPGWVRMNTYSGKLAENVVQKVARDKQMSAIRRLHDHAYPIVMHTYDEVVSEVPEGFGSVEELEGYMTTPEPWNEGWPLKAAGGWRAKRYRKG